MRNLIIFSILFFISSCTTQTFSPVTGEPQPLLKQAMTPRSTVLVVTSVNSQISAVSQGWFSINSHSYTVTNASLNSYAAQTAMNTLMQQGYRVNAGQLPNNEWTNEELEATSSGLLRHATVGLTQSMVAGNMVLKSELTNELHILNSKLQADYILLIVSHGADLFCTDSKGDPIHLTFKMILIDAHTDRVLTWRDFVIAENEMLYSKEKNRALCQAILNDHVSLNDVQMLRNWLRYYTNQMGSQLIPKLLEVK